MKCRAIAEGNPRRIPSGHLDAPVDVGSRHEMRVHLKDLRNRIDAVAFYSQRFLQAMGSKRRAPHPLARAEFHRNLVTETIGNIGFDEGISTWVADAKKRFLKPDAAIVPQHVDAVASLVSVPRDYATIERWSQPLLTLDFAPLRRIVLSNVLWTDLSPAAICTPPAVVFGTDFSGAPEALSGGVRVEALKDAVVHGIGLWFRSNLTAGISITNAPPNAVIVLIEQKLNKLASACAVPRQPGSHQA